VQLLQPAGHAPSYMPHATDFLVSLLFHLIKIICLCQRVASPKLVNHSKLSCIWADSRVFLVFGQNPRVVSACGLLSISGNTPIPSLSFPIFSSPSLATKCSDAFRQLQPKPNEPKVCYESCVNAIIFDANIYKKYLYTYNRNTQQVFSCFLLQQTQTH